MVCQVAVGLPDGDHVEPHRPSRGEHEGIQLDQEAWHHHAPGPAYCRRIYAEEKAKVVAASWGKELLQFLAAL